MSTITKELEKINNMLFEGLDVDISKIKYVFIPVFVNYYVKKINGEPRVINQNVSVKYTKFKNLNHFINVIKQLQYKVVIYIPLEEKCFFKKDMHTGEYIIRYAYIGQENEFLLLRRIKLNRILQNIVEMDYE